MAVKTCSKCGRELPQTRFYSRKDAKDGKHSTCKDCYVIYGRKKTCSKCKRELHPDYFKKGKEHCEPCRTERTPDGWLMTVLGSTYACERCVFEATCKNNIQVGRRDWNPYCFVEAKYHSFYVAEYAR